MIRVLVADDHAVVRKGLAQIIQETEDLELTGEAASGYEVLDQLRSARFDLVVLDLNMPGGGGLETLKQIKAFYPGLPVLILSIHDESQYAVRVLKAGAAGYLTKESAPEQLVEAIRQVAGGHRYVSPAVAEALLRHLEHGGQGPLHGILSDREFQVMRLLATGRTVTDIADELALSVKTVSTYRARVLDKMNMKSNADLTQYAIEHGLL